MGRWNSICNSLKKGDFLTVIWHVTNSQLYWRKVINLVSRVLCFLVIDALVTVFDFQRQEKEGVLIRPRNSDEQLGEESSRMQRKSLETWELLGGILWLNLATFQPFYPELQAF